MNIEKKLPGELEKWFDARIYSRGRSYYKEGAVGELLLEEDNNDEKLIINAQIRGSQVYNTRLFLICLL